MKKICILFFALFMISAFSAGCSDDNDINDEKISVSEEIALSVSETAVPQEAYDFTDVTFDIPEGMISASENTDDLKYYLASDAENLSFISSTKQKKEANVDYSFTSESYAKSLEGQLGCSVVMNEFLREEHDGYIEYIASVSYENSGNKYDLTAYIFDTSNYLISVNYCLGGNRSCEEAFNTSKSTLSLVSLAKNVSVNDSDSSQNEALGEQ